MTTTATTPPDLLAAIEHGLGFTPEESLVAVSVRRDGILGVHLRLDAAPSLADPQQAARRTVGHLRADTEAEAVIAAVYTDAPAGHAERLLRAVAAEAAGHGIALCAALRVTGTHWHELRHRAAGAREQVRDSAVYAHMVYSGSAVRGKEPEDVPFAGPADAAEHIAATPQRAPAEAAAHWAALLGSGREPHEAEARQALADLRAGTSRDLMIAATAGDLPTPADTAGEEHLARLLLGRTGTSPDWQRIDRAEEILKGLLAHAPAGHRAGPLTALGWISWYRGTASAALAWFARAEHDAPGYRLAALLAQLAERGFLPEVCRDPATRRTGGTEHAPARPRNGVGRSASAGSGRPPPRTPGRGLPGRRRPTTRHVLDVGPPFATTSHAHPAMRYPGRAEPRGGRRPTGPMHRRPHSCSDPPTSRPLHGERWRRR